MGERTEDIRAMDEAEEEEDLGEVEGKLFSIIVEAQDTTCGNVRTQRAYRANIALSLTMLQKNTLY